MSDASSESVRKTMREEFLIDLVRQTVVELENITDRLDRFIQDSEDARG